MNSISPKIKLALLALISIVLFLGLLWASYSAITRGGEKRINQKHPYADYTSINRLVPGKSSESDVIDLVGKPRDIRIDGKTKTFLYDTPFEDFENYVVLENSTVSYALENVFGPYRGTLDDYIGKYGPESIIYNQANDEGKWHVFLDNGVAVNILGELRQVFYFIPQDETSFYDKFKDVLEITKTSAENEGPEEFRPEGESAL